nr:hypothetical protein [Lachnospiraceae bacterium]
KKSLALCLNEPDNGKDEKRVEGRSFTTEIMVYQCDHAGVDVADYVNERIDTLEGELGDVRDKIEEPDEKVAELENSLTEMNG